jgi:uncharacterized protein YlzI (FlbEa/FlbD family)
MSRIKIILLYVLFLAAMSCGSKKKVSETHIEKVKDSTIRTLQLATTNKLVVENICDSVTFAGKDFANTINNGLSSTKVSLKDNKLTIESKGDSVVSVDEFKDRIVYRDKIIERTKTVWPKWLLIGWAVALILLLFPNLAKIANTAVRKLLQWH